MSNFFEKSKAAASKAHEIYKKAKIAIDEANKRRIEQEKARQREEAAKRRAFEEQRENTRQFIFWHYRGKAYGIKKTRYQDGDYLYIKSECYLDMGGGETEHFELFRCDLPVGNGHEMVMIYAKPVGAKGGRCVRAINLSSKQYIDIEHYLDMVQESSSLDRQYGLARLNRDLVKYVNSI